MKYYILTLFSLFFLNSSIVYALEDNKINNWIKKLGHVNQLRLLKSSNNLGLFGFSASLGLDIVEISDQTPVSPETVDATFEKVVLQSAWWQIGTPFSLDLGLHASLRKDNSYKQVGVFLQYNVINYKLFALSLRAVYSKIFDVKDIELSTKSAGLQFSYIWFKKLETYFGSNIYAQSSRVKFSQVNLFLDKNSTPFYDLDWNESNYHVGLIYKFSKPFLAMGTELMLWNNDSAFAFNLSFGF